jgi:hypothetical protein
MFLRVSTVKRENKTYFYAQIVQSYRRPEDGLPAHKVIANLGQLPELDIENLKTAFSASRSNKKTTIVRVSPMSASKIPKPQSNLVYLDLAVLLEVWKTSGLCDVLKSTLPKSSSQVPCDLIIAILCLHRCQDPGSKLAATRWYETTSLPKITGLTV